jgi:hypothetical protein
LQTIKRNYTDVKRYEINEAVPDYYSKSKLWHVAHIQDRIRTAPRGTICVPLCIREEPIKLLIIFPGADGLLPSISLLGKEQQSYEAKT